MPDPRYLVNPYSTVGDPWPNDEESTPHQETASATPDFTQRNLRLVIPSSPTSKKSTALSNYCVYESGYSTDDGEDVDVTLSELKIDSEGEESNKKGAVFEEQPISAPSNLTPSIVPKGKELDSLGLQVLGKSLDEIEFLPLDHYPDEDLMNPQAHRERLQNIHDYASRNSAAAKLSGSLCLFKGNPLQFHADQMAPTSPEDHRSIKDQLAKGDPQTLTLDPSSFSSMKTFLERCSEITTCISDNVSQLRRSNFCRQQLNFLQLDRSRPNVAILRPIDLVTLLSLLRAIDRSCGIYREKEVQESHLDNIHKCLSSLDLLCGDFFAGAFSLDESLFPGDHAYTLLRTLDLIIVSYAGAHVSQFDQCCRKKLNPSDRIGILSPAPDECARRGIVVHRRTFLCLDGFLGGCEAWVFHDFEACQPNSTKLYLRTRPESFADIWGPMWKIVGPDREKSTIRYDLENGSIIMADQADTITLYPSVDPIVREDEDLSHWISDRQLRSMACNRPSICKPFSHAANLLVGASNRFSLRDNTKACHCTSARANNSLRKDGFICPFGATRTRRRVDSEAVGINIGGGALGPGVSYAMTTKVIPGRSWKEAFIKRWTLERTARNVHGLSRYCGIEMSYCTYHSRRVRIIDLFGTKTISSLVQAIDPVEDGSTKDEIYGALKDDPESLVALYKQPTTRKGVGDLVARCLDLLSLTGTTLEDDAPLSALWVIDQVENIVEFPRRYYRWCGLVQDCRDNCAFVVLEERCLISEFRRLCQNSSSSDSALPIDVYPPILETALVINDRKTLPQGMRLKVTVGEKRSLWWNVRKLEKGSFSVGPHGSLEVVGPLSSREVLMNWNGATFGASTMKYLTRRVLRKDPDKYHNERMFDELDAEQASMPTFITSV
ncbi:uncharacterized protein LY89DRAFT_743224 [Mollisia scopiformis]|uniref:Uncharacterized protein n=1 Tax=Mollisia scopiformis TaxID=149040 RepID=A0A132B497_MOLSC|nr:uncharacterized protein LY89DRAFT_743224 [Mollisia scopiformis]KUJ07222.1 hypothetical protein LY89DRAFT_743224 [Mollisia scopiformis]